MTDAKLKALAEREQFNLLAAELRNRQDAHKERIGGLMERALGAGIDPAGLRRFVAWKRQDEEKRAQREAIDHQCRFLAGEVDAPATLPIGCELARALNCYRRKLTVRQAAEELSVSTGKAGNLYKLARMFDVHVHVHVGVDKPAAALPPHDPATGEVTSPAKGIGHNSKPACIYPRPDAWQEITAARDAADAAAAAEIARIAAEKEAERERRAAEREAERARNAAIDADTLEIPAHLRGSANQRAQASQSEAKRTQ